MHSLIYQALCPYCSYLSISSRQNSAFSPVYFRMICLCLCCFHQVSDSAPSVGKPFDVTIKFTNPLDLRLTKCILHVEGPGLLKDLKLPIRSETLLHKIFIFNYCKYYYNIKYKSHQLKITKPLSYISWIHSILFVLQFNYHTDLALTSL